MTERDFLEGLLRREWGKLLGTLVRLLGDSDLAEEALQDTLVTALERWPLSGTPDNPSGWLFAVARNRAVDLIRRRDRMRSVRELLLYSATEAESDDTAARVVNADMLNLIFACCHPQLSLESQMALLLKLCCGFSTAELAGMFRVPERTIAQRIIRAKRNIRENKPSLSALSAEDLDRRIQAVLAVVYVIFNEGYTASREVDLMRAALSAQAIRLCSLLHEMLPEQANVLGLLALVELQFARTPARTVQGQLVALQDQDRTLWDMDLIRSGLEHLETALQAKRLDRYQIEASIAACHTRAKSWAQTDWNLIVSQYDLLMAVDPSPVVELNRLVAASMICGPENALIELDRLERDKTLRAHHQFHAARGELLQRLSKWDAARVAYEKALSLASNEVEREFLRSKTADCERSTLSEFQVASHLPP